MNAANTTRTIAQIATAMDRMAARRADVNRLTGAKLHAYTLLEVELNIAKAGGDPDSIYNKIAAELRERLRAHS
jgi:hypothetical protein